MPTPLPLPTKEELQNLCDSGQWHAAARRGRDLPVAPGGDAEALRLAGSAARRLGHLAQAAANLQGAVALDPESGAAWRELGMTWYDLRRLPVAEHAWGQAARLGVGDPVMEQAWDAVLVVTGRKELDRAAILHRARSFDHIAGLPSVKQWVPDDTIRLPVMFSLGAERPMETVLTIDDGPSPDITPVLLDTFRSRGVKAAFFVVGRFAAQFPHLVEQILAAGHEVYAHSWSHTPFHQIGAASIAAELDRTESVLSRLRPTPTPYPLRLPGGWGISEPSVHAAIRSWNPDSVIVQWSVSTEDWRAPVRYRIADDLALETNIRIMETIHNPGLSAPILLCHDNMIGNVRKPRELYQTFFGGLIDTFQNVGFKFGGLGVH